MIDDLIETLRHEQRKKIEELELSFQEKINVLNGEISKLQEPIKQEFEFLEDKKDKSLFDYMKLKFSKKYKREAQKAKSLFRFDLDMQDSAIRSKNNELEEAIKEHNKQLEQEKEKLEQLNDENYVIGLLLKSKPELLQNENFMIELISKNEEYIVYDRTNSEKVYEKLFEIRLNKFTEKNKGKGIYQSEIKNYNKLLEELRNPRVPEPGKYKIPHRYLFESVRKRTYLESIDTEGANLLNSYIKLDCSVAEDYGKTIETLYDDENCVLYGHVIWGKDGNDRVMAIANSIFYNGLLMNYNLDMTRTTIAQYSSAADFGTFLEHDGPQILLSIPKNSEKIFGSDGEILGGESQNNPNRPRTYVLPEFVVGLVVGKNELSEVGKEFITNDIPLERRKKYLYTASAKFDYEPFEDVLSNYHR